MWTKSGLWKKNCNINRPVLNTHGMWGTNMRKYTAKKKSIVARNQATLHFFKKEMASTHRITNANKQLLIVRWRFVFLTEFTSCGYFNKYPMVMVCKSPPLQRIRLVGVNGNKTFYGYVTTNWTLDFRMTFANHNVTSEYDKRNGKTNSVSIQQTSHVPGGRIPAVRRC